MIVGNSLSLDEIDEAGILRADKVDPILKEYASSIEDFGYVSEESGIVRGSTLDISDLARITKIGTPTWAIQPSTLIDDAIMYSYRDRDSALNPTE